MHSFEDLTTEDPFASPVQLRRPADLLVAVPFLLGFTPQNSLVVVTLADHRVRCTARLDVPTLPELPGAVQSLTHALSRLPAQELILVGYGDEDVLPVLDLVPRLMPWPVREVLRVHDGRWWSLTCPDQRCCPPGTQLPVNDPVSTRLLVATGSPAASRADVAATLAPVSQSDIDDVRAALDAVPAATRTELYAAVRAACDSGAPSPIPADSAGRALLLHALSDLMVRDACCTWNDSSAFNLWRNLVPIAPPGWVAPVATLLALTAYQRGEVALAAVALERATLDDPGYVLAQLVGEVLALGTPPGELGELFQEATQDNPLICT
jgi:hypothetical protein